MAGLRSTVWPALRIFLAARLALWAVALLTVLVFESSLDPERFRWDSERLHELGVAIDVWARWDSDWYLKIAEEGYSWPSSTPAFFPLYPAVVAVAGRVLAGHYVLAGVLVSLAAACAAAALLYHLGIRHLGEAAGRRSVLYLALFPTSFFLGAVYGESLFLLLALGCFVLAERGRLVEAGVVAGLAMLTRPAGVALLLALALFAWQRREGRRGAAAVGVACGLFVLYPLTLWIWIGRPLAFLDAQETVWRRELSAVGPFGDLRQAAAEGAWHWLAVAVLLVALCAVAWRRLGPPYGVYGLGVLAVPLSFPADGRPLLSLSRFALAIFPAFLALAWLGRRWAVHVAVVTVFAALSVLAVVKWALWEWVA